MKKTFIFSFLIILCNFFGFSQKEARLLRFPAIHDSIIIFSYAGDLYTVTENNLQAKRLTSNIGNEIFAKISPDGKTIAFTGQYDGNSEVYIMPVAGGNPKRLTYTASLQRDDVADRMGPNNIVMAWTPDGKSIIYRSRKNSYNDFRGQLNKVSVSGGLSEELPIADGGFCSFSEDGKKLAFNRTFREFRTWKYYQGGMADDIRIFDFETGQVEKITDKPSQDIFPMWYKNEVYFISDRDRIMNLFSYNTATKAVSKITEFNDYDIKFPSIGKDKIIFENAGYLFVFNISTQKTTKLNITLDFENNYFRSKYEKVNDQISSVVLYPDTDKVIVQARGEIFSVRTSKNGNVLNLTNTCGAHDRNPKVSPDGKYTAFISDKSGEFEIYIKDQDILSKPIQITEKEETYKYDLTWSPDSKKICWSDKMNRLRFVDIQTKEITEVDKSDVGEFSSCSWSPDSRYLAYVCPTRNGMNMIYIFDLKEKTKTPITETWYTASEPEFSDNGKYLFFTSARNFNPDYNNVEWNISYRNMYKIYFVLLSDKEISPLSPNFHETKSDNSKTEINFENAHKRVVELPLQAGNYSNINVIENFVYYSNNNDNSIRMFDLKTQKETLIAENSFFSVAGKKNKFLISTKGKYYVVEKPIAKVDLQNEVNLNNIGLVIDYRQEWEQIFNESWRQMRDFFYAPNMHGVDWKKMKEKYSTLLPYVNHRDDLTYLIGEMIGELNVGHAYVNSGDRPKIEKINLGLLGAVFEKDASGFFKIKEILEGANWRETLYSPLTEAGLNVSQGDFIIAINGVLTNTTSDIYSLLTGKSGTQVELMVSKTPVVAQSRKIIVTAIDSEADLYYYKRIKDNIKKVEEASDGKIGYIHIPNMLGEGYIQFSELFYPQLRKEALIIDDRGNGGGNVSPMIIERLRRELVFYNVSRNSNDPGTTPQQMHNGPKVLLLDRYSASDGDLFPYQFKYYKIGTLVGERSWGGVVGIRGSLPFIDNGTLSKPEYAKYSADGKEWVIEGHGVDPDFFVENDPAKEKKGEDEQLTKAIEIALEQISKQKKEVKMPDFPDKSEK